jgi:hypothetical protein
MISEQTSEDIFSKTTSFSLLKFKFTQIFLMGQSGFFKNDRIIGECGQILVFQKIIVPFIRQT